MQITSYSCREGRQRQTATLLKSHTHTDTHTHTHTQKTSFSWKCCFFSHFEQKLWSDVIHCYMQHSPHFVILWDSVSGRVRVWGYDGKARGHDCNMTGSVTWWLCHRYRERRTLTHSCVKASEKCIFSSWKCNICVHTRFHGVTPLTYL